MTTPKLHPSSDSPSPLSPPASSSAPWFAPYLLSAAAACLTLSGCGAEPELTPRPEQESVQQISVQEPIAFTDTPYDESISGPNTIADVKSLIPINEQFGGLERVWYGFTRAFPREVCDIERGNEVNVVDTLPMEISGVVTLHPRWFKKQSFCNTDQRFYGSFFLQDHTDGIVILRDSRVSPFSFGDRVKLKVTGVIKAFNFIGVITSSDLEVIPQDEKTPIYYETIDRKFQIDDIGRVARIRGVVTSEANNNNFNQLELQKEDDPDVEWIISIDRELGQRNPDLDEGDVVELTGPVVDSFGIKILLFSYGQIKKIKDAP